MITFGTGLIRIDVTWERLKSVSASKRLNLQYEENGSQYHLFALDDRIAYVCVIFKGTVPSVSDTTQVQNDIDKADFEFYYKPYANRPTRTNDRLVYANYRADNISSSSYFML